MEQFCILSYDACGTPGQEYTCGPANIGVFRSYLARAEFSKGLRFAGSASASARSTALAKASGAGDGTSAATRRHRVAAHHPDGFVERLREFHDGPLRVGKAISGRVPSVPS